MTSLHLGPFVLPWILRNNIVHRSQHTLIFAPLRSTSLPFLTKGHLDPVRSSIAFDALRPGYLVPEPPGFIVFEKRPCFSDTTGSGRSTDSVDVAFDTAWNGIVDDVGEIW